MKGFVSVILIVVLSGLIVYADEPVNNPDNSENIRWERQISDPENPEEMLKVKWDALVKVLEAENLELDRKKAIIDKIIDPIFDFELMSKLALGKKNWQRLSESQRQQYSELFVIRLKNSYREKISSYKKHQNAVFLDSVRNKGKVDIPMELSSDDMKMTIVYKLRKVEIGWKIYDMEIEGVSIVLTYRSQFDDILNSGTVEEFLKQLKFPEKTQS